MYATHKLEGMGNTSIEETCHQKFPEVLTFSFRLR